MISYLLSVVGSELAVAGQTMTLKRLKVSCCSSSNVAELKTCSVDTNNNYVTLILLRVLDVFGTKCHVNLFVNNNNNNNNNIAVPNFLEQWTNSA